MSDTETYIMALFALIACVSIASLMTRSLRVEVNNECEYESSHSDFEVVKQQQR